MTLHVAALCPAFVLVAGDRLLTRRQLDGTVTEWDVFTSKTLVVLAENGVLTVSFSGLAHISGRPTALHLAESVIGHSFMPSFAGGMGYATGFGPYTVNVGQVLQRIRHVLEQDLPNDPDPQRLEVMIAGWTNRRRYSDRYVPHRNPRPLLHTFEHSGHPGELARVNARPLEPFRSPNEVLTSWMPDSIDWPQEEAMRSFARLLTVGNATARDLEGFLVRAFREVAARPNSTVGADVMSIAISPYYDVRITYSRDVSGDLSTAFGPAVIGGGFMIPPQEMYGGMPELQAGDLIIKMEVDPPFPETHDHTVRYTGQYQKPWTGP